jgi:creatinine amidohydrolase
MGRRGVVLEELTWVEAEAALTPEAIVVIPIGAALKEHGPHLRLRNDWTMAEHLRARVAGAAEVVVTPTVGFHYYPAFVEYPGSVSLRLETARDLTIDIVESLSRYGPRRFYALNTGISTVHALEPARAALAARGLLLAYTDLRAALGEARARVAAQEGGSHADEIETSMMLVIDPGSVDMARAVKDHRPGAGPLTRDPAGAGTYSPTGVWGDATLATPEKGAAILEAYVAAVLRDIEALRRAPLPSASLDLP